MVIIDDRYEKEYKRRHYKYKSNYCWICGKILKNLKTLDKDKGTMHHLIPKCLNSLNNIIVPVCWDCHKKIHKIINYGN
jgi:5-methylcytosine-specific restriction endonuclease McrA